MRIAKSKPGTDEEKSFSSSIEKKPVCGERNQASSIAGEGYEKP